MIEPVPYQQHLPVIVLVALALLGAFVMWRAQQKDGFDFSNMLKDDTGKESAVRMGILVSLAISSWWTVHGTLHGIFGLYEMMLYLGTWSGVAVIAKAIETWGPRK